MRFPSLRRTLSTAIPALLLLPGLVPACRGAEGPGCVAVCGVACAKPISIADRWDDVTPIAGYAGGPRTPNWAGNGRFDLEAFTDLNGNGLYDAGEPFVDGNGNGVHDEELYDPILTGYRGIATPGHRLAPGGDLGLSLVLSPSGSTSSAAPGQYYAVGLPPANKGTPALDSGAYAENLRGCNPVTVGPDDVLQLCPSAMAGPTNQAMRDLIAQDPGAYWDDATGTVRGSLFAQSPRIWFVPVHDPRIPVSGGSAVLHVRKVLAFFAERMVGPAEVTGRLLQAAGTGDPCGGTDPGGFVQACPTTAQAASWGRVKQLYR